MATMLAVHRFADRHNPLDFAPRNRGNSTMPGAPVIAFSHLGIHVGDAAGMEDFYSRVLGFTVTDRGELGGAQLVFLSRDPREHHQIVQVAGRPERLPYNVVNQISFRVADLAELRRVYELLRGEAVRELVAVTHGNAWSLYFLDPDGNRLEIYTDTPWYVPQPLREPIDFAMSDAAIAAQTEALCRTLPGFRPHQEWRDEIAKKMRGRVGATSD
jgi:catechol 2,3-dioxygenase